MAKVRSISIGSSLEKLRVFREVEDSRYPIRVEIISISSASIGITTKEVRNLRDWLTKWLEADSE